MGKVRERPLTLKMPGGTDKKTPKNNNQSRQERNSGVGGLGSRPTIKEFRVLERFHQQLQKKHWSTNKGDTTARH